MPIYCYLLSTLTAASPKQHYEGDALGELCKEEQSLRLNFREPTPPAGVPVGEWLPLTLCTTNEFGLFQQGSLGREPVTAECR